MKFIPYRFRPSLGFLLLIVVAIATTVFFAWGLQEPDLDVAWRVEHRLQKGAALELTADERAALERALAGHPELGLAIDDEGRAVLVEANDDDDDEEGEE